MGIASLNKSFVAAQELELASLANARSGLSNLQRAEGQDSELIS
jgi:hypothetical protein